MIIPKALSRCKQCDFPIADENQKRDIARNGFWIKNSRDWKTKRTEGERRRQGDPSASKWQKRAVHRSALGQGKRGTRCLFMPVVPVQQAPQRAVVTVPCIHTAVWCALCVRCCTLSVHCMSTACAHCVVCVLSRNSTRACCVPTGCKWVYSKGSSRGGSDEGDHQGAFTCWEPGLCWAFKRSTKSKARKL